MPATALEVTTRLEALEVRSAVTSGEAMPLKTAPAWAAPGSLPLVPVSCQPATCPALPRFTSSRFGPFRYVRPRKRGFCPGRLLGSKVLSAAGGSNRRQLPAHPSPVATGSARKQQEKPAILPPFKSSDKTSLFRAHDNGFLVCSSDAFLASPRRNATLKGQASFSTGTRLTELLLCTAFPPCLELLLASALLHP